MSTDMHPGRRENLDEVIDRVAAALTAVAADPGLATRLEGRLTARRASWLEPRGMIAATLAVAVVALAVSLTIRRSEPRVAPAPVVATAVPGTEVRSAASPSAAGVDRATMAAVTRAAPPAARPRRRYISHDHVVPHIAALSVPVALDVDDVDPMLLTIEPVELAPLDLANLTFSDLESPDHPKE